jgi:hypothetical protein
LKQTSPTPLLLHALQALTLDPSKQQTVTSNKTALHLFYTNPQNWANAQVNTPLGHAEPEAQHLHQSRMYGCHAGQFTLGNCLWNAIMMLKYHNAVCHGMITTYGHHAVLTRAMFLQAACQKAGGNLASVVDWYTYMTLQSAW